MTPIETVVANKTTPLSEEGVEEISPPVTQMETEVASVSTQLLRGKKTCFNYP